MSIPTVAWDETSPAGSQAISLGDNRIREMKTQIREVINVDHDFPSSGSAADNGQHKKMTLQEQADLGTGAEGVPILGAQTVSGKAELVFTDEDDNDIQITSGGLLMVGQLANDTYFTATDNAGTGTINLIKGNASDLPELGAGVVIAGTAAPASDYAVATKKYVDENAFAEPAGIVKMWGGDLASPPAGYLTCDGSAVSRTTYADLFTVIGTTYGAGDGSTTFNLPNFTNRFPYGANEGSSAGNASVGSANTRTLSGNDDSVTLPLTGTAGGTGGGSLLGSQDAMNPYLAVGFIIKT